MGQDAGPWRSSLGCGSSRHRPQVECILTALHDPRQGRGHSAIVEAHQRHCRSAVDTAVGIGLRYFVSRSRFRKGSPGEELGEETGERRGGGEPTAADG